MSTNLLSTFLQAPYLRTSRSFPVDPQALSVEIDRSYIDVANAVNSRTIGIFPINMPVATGEYWYLGGTSQRQQSVRQVFTFTTTTSINHNIQNIIPGQFTKCTGSYTDGTNTYGLIFGTSISIIGQILFYITSTQIVFVVDGGAPALSSGTVVLEWLLQF